MPTDEQLASGQAQAETALRKEWGAEYEARLALARQAYRQAVARLPWLGDLMEDAGGGNSVALVKHFANVGLTSARRAHK